MKANFLKKLYDADNETVEYIMEHFLPVKEAAGKLVSMGITKENADEFFTGGGVPFDPFLMEGMKEAVELIGKKVYDGQDILIYGDYDADGVSAAAILKLFFDEEDIPCRVRLPSRDEGYGIHYETVKREYEKKAFGLVVTVDCGISGKDEIRRIREELGIDVIVTDHHEIPRELPDCICVNPKMGYPFPYLSGSGVALKLAEAMTDADRAFTYADLAAVGIIGDLMPLLSENRMIVRQALAKTGNAGLAQLCRYAGVRGRVTVSDYAMKLCPRINAAGRVDTPDKALTLFLEQEEECASELCRLNEIRKEMVKEATGQAEVAAEAENGAKNVLILENDAWHTGILGIIAARIKEKYNKPVFIFGKRGDSYVGSGRGSGVNMFEALTALKDTAEHFGGHENSVGLSVKQERFTEFKSKAEEYFSEFPVKEEETVYDIDFDTSGDIKEIGCMLERLEPIYPSDRIVFRTVGTVEGVRFLGNGSHAAVSLEGGFTATGFNDYALASEYLRPGVRVEILFVIDRNERNGYQAVIRELRVVPSLRLEEIYAEIFLKRAVSVKRKYILRPELEKYIREGRPLVFFSSDEARLFTGEGDFEDYTFNFFELKGRAKKNIVIAPVSDVPGGVYITGCEGFDYAPENAEVFCMGLKSIPFLSRLDISREKCAIVFRKAAKNKRRFLNVEDAYRYLEPGSVTYVEFLAVMRVLGELGIFRFNIRPFELTYQPGIKGELEESELYRFVRG